ncbi:hypothetical protein FN846DRAFT_419761 [Sphaerosporella brunnea]|uniref:Uncharacterized protein n=1 Tax=Sphaerosporella brunnea TaxID=1250544 RepID=A0A5J5EH03_9PEZI|nr:hypothetical protein FN846DRAFT_419761 [Sphaerosporella brunnea]
MASNPIDPNLELVAAADPPPVKSEDKAAVADPEEEAAKLRAAKEAQRLRKNHLSTVAYAHKKAQREKEAADHEQALADKTEMPRGNDLRFTGSAVERGLGCKHLRCLLEAREEKSIPRWHPAVPSVISISSTSDSPNRTPYPPRLFGNGDS